MTNLVEIEAQISARRLSILKQNLARLNAKLEKHGVHPYTLEVGKRKMRWVQESQSIHAQGTYVEALDIKIVGERFRLGKYRIGAFVDHRETPTRIISYGDFKIPPAYHSPDPQSCDHCNTRRDRATTWLLVAPDDDVKHIGNSCLELYTGVSPTTALAATSVFSELKAMLKEELDILDQGMGGAGSLNQPSIKLHDVLVLASYAIRNYGWTSRATAEGQMSYGLPTDLPTGFVVSELYKDVHYRGVQSPATDEDQAIAQKVMAFFKTFYRNQDHLSGLDLTMSEIAKVERITNGMISTAAYMVQVYRRSIEALAQEELIKPSSRHIGEKGARSDFVLNVVRIVKKENICGIKYIHTLADDDGNAFVWYGNGKPLQAGHRYELRATISGHTEYNGIKQTVLQRIKPTKDLGIYQIAGLDLSSDNNESELMISSGM